MDCILTMASQTYAIKGKNALRREGIHAEVVNVDPKLTSRGCSFGLRFSCMQTEKVQRTLTARAIPYGEIFGGKV